MSKNPQDSTRRNIQAANKKILALKSEIKEIKSEQKRQDKVLKSLVKNLEEVIVT